jgi:hypothetical protein
VQGTGSPNLFFIYVVKKPFPVIKMWFWAGSTLHQIPKYIIKVK